VAGDAVVGRLLSAPPFVPVPVEVGSALAPALAVPAAALLPVPVGPLLTAALPVQAASVTAQAAAAADAAQRARR
jgi:hypothetical protein